MDASKQLIIVNGKDKTESIVSTQFRGRKCDVTYYNSLICKLHMSQIPLLSKLGRSGIFCFSLKL